MVSPMDYRNYVFINEFFFTAISREVELRLEEVELHPGHCGAVRALVGLLRSTVPWSGCRHSRALVGLSAQQSRSTTARWVESQLDGAHIGGRRQLAPKAPWGVPAALHERRGGGGGAAGEVWVTDETDPYFGCRLNESQNASSLWSPIGVLFLMFYTQFGDRLSHFTAEGP
jgi:hypothetical protein